MNSILKGFMALGCLLMASSCSEISFGDKFLGNQPESSGATTKEMFSSRINAEKVLTKAYTLRAAHHFRLEVGCEHPRISH